MHALVGEQYFDIAHGALEERSGFVRVELHAVQRGGWCFSVADITHQDGIIAAGQRLRHIGACRMQNLHGFELVPDPGGMVQLLAVAGALGHGALHAIVDDIASFDIELPTSLAVQVVVLQVAEAPRAVDLGGDIRMIQPGCCGVRQALVDVGFFAAFQQAQHIADPKLVVILAQRSEQPHAFVTCGLVAEFEHISLSIALQHQFFGDRGRPGLVDSFWLATLFALRHVADG